MSIGDEWLIMRITFAIPGSKKRNEGALIWHHFDGQYFTVTQGGRTMGQTKKRNYDRCTLDYKIQAVKLANHPDVMSKTIAESLVDKDNVLFPMPSQLLTYVIGAPVQAACSKVITTFPFLRPVST